MATRKEGAKWAAAEQWPTSAPRRPAQRPAPSAKSECAGQCFASHADAASELQSYECAGQCFSAAAPPPSDARRRPLVPPERYKYI